MAWIDNRIWAHPKLLACTPRARWVYVAGLAYSAGFSTRGTLTKSHQKAIGSTAKTRQELVQNLLWHESETERGSVEINDWDEHNEKRDDALEARRQADRDRKHRERERRRTDKSHVTVTGQEVTGRHVTRPRDVLVRARAGAPPVTDDVLTEEPVPAPAPEVRPPARDDPPEPVDDGAGAGAGWNTDADLHRLNPLRALPT